MAIYECRNDWPAALARSISGGWRAERSCWLARNAATWRQRKKIGTSHWGQRSASESGSALWRLIGQQKDRYGRGLTQQFIRKASAKATTTAIATPHQERDSKQSCLI